jgi:hypothetical protein
MHARHGQRREIENRIELAAGGPRHTGDWNATGPGRDGCSCLPDPDEAESGAERVTSIAKSSRVHPSRPVPSRSQGRGTKDR